MRLFLAAAALLLLPSAVLAQRGNGGSAICPYAVAVSSVAAGETQLVTAPTGATTLYNGAVPTTVPSRQSIHICTVTLKVKQTATPANFGLAAGTGAACVTGTTTVTPLFLGTASVTDTYQESFTMGGGLSVPVGNGLCLNMSVAPTGAQALITYGIY
jgi:hypothetical protein